MANVEFREPDLLPLSDIPTVFPMDSDPGEEEEEDDDIYRGLPDDQISPSVISVPQPPPRPESSASGTSSSSSSGYSVSGRLGALAAVVEQAIARWARRNSSSSSIASSSSSSSASRSALSIQTKSTKKRRRRYSTDHNARSERDIRARLKARQETRRIPRGFSLYVPPQLRTSRPSLSDAALEYDEQGVLRTHLLPVVLNRVQCALRLSEKLRQPERAFQRNINIPTILIDGVPQTPPMVQGRDRKRAGKGKNRDPNSLPRQQIPRRVPDSAVDPEKGPWPSWWLDISSPTSTDMKALGKLLHLHPLTLEDILQQDPREKMELFPKLGYYFIVFKAIESDRTRDRLDRLTRRSVDSLPATNLGVIAEDLIYLVVLRDGRGICTFHFTDISEHLSRVREKVLLLDENINKSSDWIAHGILDSVVDSFFPFVAQIDREVDEIEKFLSSDPDGSGSDGTPKATPAKPKTPSTSALEVVDEKSDSAPNVVDESKDDVSMTTDDEKPPLSPVKSQQQVKTTVFRASPLPISLYIRRARRFLKSKLFKTPTRTGIGEPWMSQKLSPTTRTVHKMAKIRILMTSLTRLLSTKADLIRQIRKRLIAKGEWSLDSDPELYIHMGDILDHVLSLQQNLAYHERTLAQSHPIYQTQLGIRSTMAKGNRDIAIITLTITSIGVIIVQTLIGMFSMNVKLPTNGKTPEDPLYLFGVVVVSALCIISIYLLNVRRWWRNAKKRAQRHKL